MGSLGGHRANDWETLRLELGVLPPLAFFHLRQQRGASALHRLLQAVVRAAKRRQQPDDDEKEHKKHDGVPNGNQRMLIRGSTEYVAEEPHARAQRSHCESRRAPGHPSREARGQQVKSRYCPLASCDIIDEPEADCKHDSGKRRKDLRHGGSLWYRIHVHAQSSVKISSGCATPCTA